MNRITKSLAGLVTGLLMSMPALAAFHLWDINEVFSNSDGTIQYIELRTTAPSEGFLTGHTIVSSGPGVTTQQYTFNSNLAGNTSNRTFLLATQRFAYLTGLTPDYTIPAGFIPLSGGTLNFGEGSDILNFSREQFPLNGVQSINGNAQPEDATPTRFDGLSAQVPSQAEPYTSFHTPTSVLNIPVLNAPGIGVANVNFAVDLLTLEFNLLDYYLYDPGISAGTLPTQFQNGTVLYVPALIYNNEQYEANLNMLSDDPIVFGNPEVLSVIPVPQDPGAEPEPPNNPPLDNDEPPNYG